MRWGTFEGALGPVSLTPGRKPDLGAKAKPPNPGLAFSSS